MVSTTALVKNKLICALLALTFASVAASPSFAACTSPAGNAGAIIYSSTTNIMTYCNGTSWVGMGQSSAVSFSGLTTGAFCTATSSTAIACTTTAINAATQITGTLPAANGGTGVANTGTITLGGNLTTSGAYTLTLTTTGTTNVTLPTSGTLITNAVTALSSLSTIGTITTGTWNGTAIAVGYGGTGTTTAFTQGSVVFAGASGIYSQDNDYFFWDATNHRLGIGTSGPNTLLEISNADAWGQNFGAGQSPGGGLLIAPSYSVPSLDGLTIAAGGLQNYSTLGFTFGLIGVNTYYDKTADTLKRYGSSGGYTDAQAITLNADHSQTNGNRMSFWTGDAGNPSERMVITNTGLVGIGTAVPITKLDFGNSLASLATGQANALRLYSDGSVMTSTTGNNVGFGFNASTGQFSLTTGTSGFLSFFTSNVEQMRITSGGNVGIGTTAPTAKLDVTGGMLAARGSSSSLAALIANAAEPVTVSATAATGTINYYLATQSILYYTTAASANWIVNFALSSGTTMNSALAVGQAVTAVFLVMQGTTAYYNTAVQIDGTTTGVTTYWLGGSAPATGYVSGIDVYQYTIIKTAASTYTVLASQTQY